MISTKLILFILILLIIISSIIGVLLTISKIPLKNNQDNLYFFLLSLFGMGVVISLLIIIFTFWYFFINLK